jgi:hypothetical protein
MKIFDCSNCGKAVSDEREPAKLSLWRRVRRALGFDRFFAKADRIEIELAKARVAARSFSGACLPRPRE